MTQKSYNRGRQIVLKRHGVVIHLGKTGLYSIVKHRRSSQFSKDFESVVNQVLEPHCVYDVSKKVFVRSLHIMHEKLTPFQFQKKVNEIELLLEMQVTNIVD